MQKISKRIVAKQCSLMQQLWTKKESHLIRHGLYILSCQLQSYDIALHQYEFLLLYVRKFTILPPSNGFTIHDSIYIRLTNKEICIPLWTENKPDITSKR